MEPEPGGPQPDAADESLQNLDLDDIEDDIDLDDLEYQQLLREQIDFANEEAAAEVASLQAAHAAAVANTAAIAAAVNEAGQQNNNQQQRPTIVHLGSCTTWTIILYLTIFALLKIIIVGAEWNQPCQKQLHIWAVVQSILELIMIFTKLYINFRISQPEFMDLIGQGVMPQVRGLLAAAVAFNRLFNFSFFVWWIVGLSFYFGSGLCEAANLRRLMAVQIFIELALVVAVAVLFLVATALLAYFWWRRPEVFYGPNRGANQSDINKLKELKFDSAAAMGIASEDAQCAICLSAYEKGEKIRYLPCNHHFHSPCIDEWLLKNKTCPFCKRAIDSPGAQTQAQAQTQEQVENAV